MDSNGSFTNHVHTHRHLQKFSTSIDEQEFIPISSPTRSRLHLDFMNEPCLKGDNLEYDEIDLLSECSTPAAYVPGQYLQLFDLETDATSDVTPWPVSMGPAQCDVDMKPLLSRSSHIEEEGHRSIHSQMSRKSQRLTLRSPKLLIPIIACLIVALTALGGLATVL